LGLECHPDDIYALVRNIDSQNNGTISAEDFDKAFFIDKSEITDVQDFKSVHVQPRVIKELSTNHTKEYVEYKEIKLDRAILSKCEISLKKPKEVTMLWSTAGSSARSSSSIWVPNVEGSIIGSRNKESICVGHYASNDLNSPADKKLAPMLIRITDNSVNRLSKSNNMEIVIKACFPLPKKYVQVWSSIQTETPLYLWSPVPPTKDFVALGVVATTTPEEPDQNLVHCVPKRWCVPARVSDASKLWDNSGLGGKKGSFWQLSSLQLFNATATHLAPQDMEWFELFKSEFVMTDSVPGYVA